MSRRLFAKIFALGMALLIFISVATAFAANLEVAPSNLGQTNQSVTANQLKPSECTQNLSGIVRGTGEIFGTQGNDLIVGSSGDDTIQGNGGDDCILGAAGDDSIFGGDGADVCFGGDGANLFEACETEVP